VPEIHEVLDGGAGALPDYELLELVLFAAIPQRDVKPLAKDLLARFGGLVATDLVDVTSDVGALDGGGWWAVVAPYGAPPVLARFARVAPPSMSRRGRPSARPAPAASTKAKAFSAWRSRISAHTSVK